jgi:hypothetical protein
VYHQATIELHQLTLDQATDKKDDSSDVESHLSDINDMIAFKQIQIKLYENVLNCLISMELEPAKAREDPELIELV